MKPDLYTVDGDDAYWLEPAADVFGDPDVELAQCAVAANGVPDFAAGALVGKPGADAKIIARIEKALRAVALARAA